MYQCELTVFSDLEVENRGKKRVVIGLYGGMLLFFTPFIEQ